MIVATRWLHASCVIAALGTCLAAEAAPVLLEDGVAFVTIDPESPDGVTAWTVNGVPHVRTQSLWFAATQIGPEAPISALGLVAAATTDENEDGRDETLELVYESPGFLRIDVLYTLTGSPIDLAGEALGSALDVEISMLALSEPLDVRLYEYTDVDLSNSPADDMALFSGDPLIADVTDASELAIYQSAWSPEPDIYEAGVYDTTLAALLDDQATVLDGTAIAAGDVTVTSEWIVPVPSDGAVAVAAHHEIHVMPAPEPSEFASLLFVAVGLGIVTRRREETAR